MGVGHTWGVTGGEYCNSTEIPSNQQVKSVFAVANVSIQSNGTVNIP